MAFAGSTVDVIALAFCPRRASWRHRHRRSSLTACRAWFLFVVSFFSKLDASSKLFHEAMQRCLNNKIITIIPS